MTQRGRQLRDRYFWYVVIMAALAAMFSYAPQLSSLLHMSIETNWQVAYYSAAYRLLLPLAAAVAAWRFGVRGGMVVSVITGVVVLGGVLVNWRFPNELLDFLDVALCFAISWVVGKQGEMKLRLEETAAELEQQSVVLKNEIAERKQAEEQYRLVTEHSADVIYKLRIKDQRYVYVSPSAERLFGYTEKEILALDPRDMITAESYDMQASQFEKDIASNTPERILQLEAVHKDGRILPVEVHSRLIFDEKGEPVEIVGVARDITERKKMEEQLIMQDRLASIGQLSAGIAHEVNNPLTGVVTFSTLLLDRELPDDVRADLEVINEQAKRTAKIVKNLLTFARKQPQEKQPVDINQGIQRILELRAYEQKVNNIRVEARLAPDLPPVFGNNFELEQVFLNIVINAEFFMGDAHGEGTLTITTEKAGDFVRATFTDDGPGISRENMRRLFNPFFTTKEVGKGTGLGLSICHGIITEHDGRIWAESEPDKGTAFIIELPVYSELR